MNEEKVEQLERSIQKSRIKCRVIEGLLLIIGLVVLLVCLALREASKEVIVHGELFFKWEEVVYNNNYLIGIGIGAITAGISVIVLVTDSVFCRYATIESKGHYVTVYRSMMKNIVYVNGEEKERIVLFSFTFVIETSLPNCVKVIVTFSRSAFIIAHIAFSDNTPSIDV